MHRQQWKTLQYLIGANPLNQSTCSSGPDLCITSCFSFIPNSKHMNVSLEQAQKAIQAAVAKSTSLGLKMNIAVVDAGANLVAFARMDGAWLGSVDIAIKKAKTARFFDMNTGEIGKLSQPGGALYNIEHSNGGLISFPGGIPVKNGEGVIVGAIGVSGSTVENDHIVAEAGVASF
jgi:uncharacterized protein GlcG (DUF336 family)